MKLAKVLFLLIFLSTGPVLFAEDPDVQSLDDQAVLLIRSGQYRQCLQLLEQYPDLMKIPKRTNKIERLALPLRWATCLIQLAEYELAETALLQLNELAQKKVFKQHELGREFAYQLALLYDFTGRSLLSKSIVESLSRETATPLQVRNTIRLHNLLGTYAGANNHYPKAFTHFINALGLYERVKHLYPEAMLYPQLNMAEYYLKQGNPDKALDVGRQALRIADSLGNKVAVGSCYIRLAQIHLANTEYDRAEHYFIEADIFYATQYDSLHPFRIDVLRQLGELYNTRGDRNRSVSYFQRAMNRMKQKKGKWLDLDKAQIYHNAGLNYLMPGSLDTARQLIDSAMLLINDFLELEIRAPEMLYTTWNSKALLYYYEADYEAAAAEYIKMIRYGETTFGPLHLLVLTARNNLAAVYGKMSRNDFSLLQYDTILQYLGLFPENVATFAEVSDISTATNVLWNRADALYQIYFYGDTYDKPNISRAAEAYNLYLQWLDYLRSGYFSEANKLKLARDNQLAYRRAVASNVQTHYFDTTRIELEHAFAASERSRSLILLEKFQDEAPLTALDWELQEELAASRQSSELIMALEDTLHQLQQMLRKDEHAIQRAKKQIVKHKEAYFILREGLKEKFPDYYHRRYFVQPVSVPEVQRGLASDECMLEYYSNGNLHWGFLITTDTAIVEFLGKVEGLGDSVRHLVNAITAHHVNGITDPYVAYQNNKTYDRMASWMFDFSIAIFKPYLKTKVQIISGEAFVNLPFEALLTDTIANTGIFNHYPFFGKDHIIAYQPSATIWSRVRQFPREASLKKWAVFAPTYLHQSLPLSTAPNDSVRYGELMTNILEAEMIADILKDGGDTWLQEEATKGEFKSSAGDYGILHLSGHGIGYGENGAYLIFHDRESTPDKALLYAYEVYNMQIPAELVVFSACETGVGILSPGEGTMSMARAFSYAGTKSIVSTWWNIEERSTSSIFSNFYQALLTGTRKDVALQKAKHLLMTSSGSYSDPFYWAGLKISGNVRPLQP